MLARTFPDGIIDFGVFSSYKAFRLIGLWPKFFYFGECFFWPEPGPLAGARGPAGFLAGARTPNYKSNSRALRLYMIFT